MILFVALGKSHNSLCFYSFVWRSMIACIPVLLEELINTQKAQMERRKVLMIPKSYWKEELSWSIQPAPSSYCCATVMVLRWGSVDKFKTYWNKCFWMLLKDSKTTIKETDFFFFRSVCSIIRYENSMASENSLSATHQNPFRVKETSRRLVACVAWPSPTVHLTPSWRQLSVQIWHFGAVTGSVAYLWLQLLVTRSALQLLWKVTSLAHSQIQALWWLHHWNMQSDCYGFWYCQTIN